MSATGLGADEDLGAAWMRSMRAGDWDSAWRIADAVVARRAGARDWSQPRHLQAVWDGTPLEGRRVLVRCYHGLGDTLQFIRFVPRLREKAASVAVWVQPTLIPLLATMPGVGTLLPLHDGSPELPYDVDVEIMELAHALRITEATLPVAVPYLHAPPRVLAVRDTFAVGLVWRAGDWDRRRSIPPEMLAPLAAVPGVSWHLLQRGKERCPGPGFGLEAGSDDPLVAAGIMGGLDLVVTVDSMPAHLAGATGVPVWTLLAEPADWRWQDGREDSPWYPTMRLFRQARPGDWSGVIARVASALKAAACRAPDA